MNSIYYASTFLLLLLVSLTPATGQDLNQKVDAAIAKVHARGLKADFDTPWVIMHAAIAFENDLMVTRADGTKVNAIRFLLNEARDGNGPLYRYDIGYPGSALTGEAVPGIRTRNITPGFNKSFILQDHVDQFLYAYADANVPLGAVGRSGARQFSIATLLDASSRAFAATQELGWTLVVMSHYLPIHAQWQTVAGQEISVEDIMALAIKRDPNRETEGGPHHLYGVAYALQRYRDANPNNKLTGVWAGSADYLNKYADLARAYQNEDGSFSNAMFRGQQLATSSRSLVWSTGHTLEWLCRALPLDQLTKPWITDAVERLAGELLQADLETLSMGGLYHAAHALRLWREQTGT